MKSKRLTLLVAAGIVTVGFVVSQVFAATNTRTLGLSAGSNVKITCPNALTNSGQTANGETVNCAANTTTTTTVPATTTTVANTPTVPSGAGGAPTTPPVTWCETGLPASPYSRPPAGAVTIPAGDDSGTAIAHDYTIQPNTTYWFAPGTHTLASDQYAQISPASGDLFVGAPGAVIDGQGVNDYAFSATSATNVTVEYLTVQHFMAGSGEAVVGQDATDAWTIKYDLIQNNPHGAGAAITSDGTVADNCLYNNGEYGYTAQGEHGTEHDVILTNNEISFNNSAHYYDLPGSTIQCGCSGGGKFWQTTNATVTGNYIHDNGGPGVWVDTDNAGFNISGNYLSHNWGEGIMYETSYNAEIIDNTLVGNTIGEGSSQASPGFPDGAIYISESGGDSRVASNYAGKMLISANVLSDNWGGIVLWENADRYCSDGFDGACTLVDPATYTVTSCAAHLSEKSPVDYYDNCRWKTQNVQVNGNTLSFNPANVASNCNQANLCGFTALFSNYGTSIYGSSRTIAITFQQHNLFEGNTYKGPWSLFAWSQSNLDNAVTWAQWTRPVTDKCGAPAELSGGACNSGFGQDAGSLTG